MQRRLILQTTLPLLAIATAIIFIGVRSANAQTTDSSSTLRATIETEILSDPRAQTMSQAQVNSMVGALTAQAQQQGVTAQQLTYAPALAVAEPSSITPSCSGFFCALGNAFGLNGSLPLIPIALFILAALFIFIFSIMREMGHPHAKHWGDKGTV